MTTNDEIQALQSQVYRLGDRLDCYNKNQVRQVLLGAWELLRVAWYLARNERDDANAKWQLFHSQLYWIQLFMPPPSKDE